MTDNIDERIKYQFQLWDRFQEQVSAPAPARQEFMDALDKMWCWTIANRPTPPVSEGEKK